MFLQKKKKNLLLFEPCFYASITQKMSYGRHQERQEIILLAQNPLPLRYCPQRGWLEANQGVHPQSGRGGRLTLWTLSSVAKVLAFW